MHERTQAQYRISPHLPIHLHFRQQDQIHRVDVFLAVLELCAADFEQGRAGGGIFEGGAEDLLHGDCVAVVVAVVVESHGDGGVGDVVGVVFVGQVAVEMLV